MLIKLSALHHLEDLREKNQKSKRKKEKLAVWRHFPRDFEAAHLK